MTAKWYTISVRGKFEQKIKSQIEYLTVLKGLNEDVKEVLVLTEQCIVMIKGKKQTVEKNAMPGYMFVNIIPSEKMFDLISSIDGVLSIVGNDDAPSVMQDKEIEDLKEKSRIKSEKEPEIRFTFEKGNQIKIVEGPLAGYTGTVSEANSSKNKMKVTMPILGRPVDVEIDFLQAILIK